MKISTVAQMRALDKTAIKKYGISQELLMENAGLAAFSVLSEKAGIEHKKYIIFCGTGNNGGDGLVVARKIHSNGGVARIYLIGDAARFSGAAALNLEIATRMGVPVTRLESVDDAKSELLNCDGVVDALLGTGIDRDVSGVYKDVIELINGSGKTILSLDIPSGINGDTGQVMGIAVQANYTVTFGLPKIGNMLFPGHSCCGDLSVTHISFPPVMMTADDLKIETCPMIDPPLRNPDGHKGSFGQALFIAGAAGYYGAPYLSAMSYLKAGGGYSRLAGPASLTPFIAARGSEIVFIPQKETSAGSISFENRQTLLKLANKMDMVILGPGLSLEPETRQIAMELAAEIDRPLLIDGDGISAVSKAPEIIRQRTAATILTPHLGEMSRLTKKTTREIEKHKIDIVRRTARDLRAIVVLKGAHSLTGLPDERVIINLSGNSGMATAGSGDVLTGTIGAMFGMGLPVEEAVIKGVFIHGLAGDLAAGRIGEDGTTAKDILNALPGAVKMDRSGFSDRLKRRYSGPAVI
ncbi:MAG: bifunctional ADP-dependent NAD(P)H-hydrate dehydratase/NAD(P)H-hydrate epimerase [Desulfobacteraceae bacterium 4572_123]|nr:MAG: bifunctional ADP-dependent NAD(P)H-hydrate dehydratase/NAD(P)H-hydrate epimerase [Desulfobacteraceae bacterium 4572_123]